jgi:hypothetical protein
MPDLLFALLLSVLLPILPAQGCDGRGSERVAALWESGPRLQCPYEPNAPGFRLFTPAHRAVVRRAGFQLGEAHAREQWIVRYRCTGLWFLPVVAYEVRAYGIVLDVGQVECEPR